MAKFSYEARSSTGERRTGEMDARSRVEALERLRRDGLRPVSLKESDTVPRSTGPGGSDADSPPLTREIPRLSGAQVIVFTEELSELLDAGLQLEPALRIIEQRQEKSPLRPVSAFLRQQVRDGVSFSRALKACGRNFSELYSNMVAAGEASGALPQILRRQCQYLIMMDDLQRRIASALVYPSIVFTSAIVLMFVFLTFLVPQLTSLLSKTGQQLPLVTRLLIFFSEFFGRWWWAVLIVLAAIGYGVWQALQTPKGRAWWDRTLLHLPLVGPVVRARFFAQLLQTLATLVTNGVALFQGLTLMHAAIPNVELKRLLADVSALVGEGGHFSRAMKKVGFFPPMLIDILAVGEQTGDLAGALERAAKKYDRELTSRIQHITTLVQPLVILLVAGFVGIVAYSMIAGILTSVNSLRAR